MIIANFSLQKYVEDTLKPMLVASNKAYQLAKGVPPVAMQAVTPPTNI